MSSRTRADLTESNARLAARVRELEASREKTLDVIDEQRAELRELRALRAEVLDVCSRAPVLVPCSACNGEELGRFYNVGDGLRWQPIACSACNGRGVEFG